MRIIFALFALTIALSLSSPAAVDTVKSPGLAFSPDSLRITPGDTVVFAIAAMHNAVEVSQSTWLANDTTPNGGFSLPFGGGTVVLTDTGVHYYVCQVHVSFNGMKGRIFVAPPQPPDSFLTVDRAVTVGWNIVSLPVGRADRSVTGLFPGAVSRAFSYNGAYVPETAVAVGSGYWLKFGADQNVSIKGIPAERDSVNALKGWNLIGSLPVRRLHTAITSSPPGIINSPFFGFNGSYFVSDTIVPGFGYWVRLNDQGTLIFDTLASAAIPRTSADQGFIRSAARLTVRDAAERAGSLYIREGDPMSYPSFSDLPPVPPPGAFDIRFASGKSVTLISPGETGQFPILFSSPAYPITISWDMQEMSRPLSLRVDGSAILLSHTGAIRLATPARSLSLNVASERAMPAEYSLSDAYPNPFNPATVVQYSLPSESRVLVRVYNVLGERVPTLVDALESPGEKSVSWNTEGSRQDASHETAQASQVYFIRMDASPANGTVPAYSRVIKAMLLK